MTKLPIFKDPVNVKPPKFMFAPDGDAEQLYIIHTGHPLCLIWVQQTMPAKLFVIQSEVDFNDLDTEEETDKKIKVLEPVLRDAAEWYRVNVFKAGGFKMT